MSPPSSRPPVPRPTVRKTLPPPAPAVVPSIPPSSPAIAVNKGYVEKPPVIRDRMPTLELEAGDIMEEEIVAEAPRSTPPPPPPVRSTVVPKGIDAPVPKIAPMPLPKIEPQIPEAAISEVKPKLDSMLDPSEALFDGMYDLNYADSLWQAARLCASSLGRALGARTVIVHTHDLTSRELRAVGVHGEGEFDVLGSSDHSDDDLVASAAICNQKPVTMRFDGELPRLAPQRLALVGAPRTLVAVPVLAWGRCVALIEIIDADERYASRVPDSAAYVAERLAAFLSDRAAA